MEKCLIVALADNRAIGVSGGMPWHISEDLKYFKRVTMGCPVIMGRRTYESIGRPLPGRLNIVVSSNAEAFAGTPVVCVPSLEKAFEAAADAPRVFVMGGAMLYAAALPLMDRLYLTLVHTSVEGADAFFPEFDLAQWREESRSEMQTDPESGLAFEFVVYSRA